VGVQPRTDAQTDTHRERQTDTQARVTTIHFASSTTHAKCNYSETAVKKGSVKTKDEYLHSIYPHLFTADMLPLNKQQSLNKL